MQHRLEWTGDHWDVIITNGPDQMVRTSLDEFLMMAESLKTDLLLDDPAALEEAQQLQRQRPQQHQG
jgi:hypothetical protein